VVYAAAGIAHYDGTYVYALDAQTGAVRWHNDTSGSLSAEVDCGVSLQGPLSLVNGELRFLGGGKYEVARFDCQTGRCLNVPDNSVAARFRTAFYPYYPEYGRYVWLDRQLPDGHALVCEASYDDSQHTPLALLKPLPPGTANSPQPQARLPLSRRGPRRQAEWTDATGRRFNALICSRDVLLAASDRTAQAQQAALAAIEIRSGRDLWSVALPAPVVRAGLAVDHQAAIVASLENGQLVAF